AVAVALLAAGAVVVEALADGVEDGGGGLVALVSGDLVEGGGRVVEGFGGLAAEQAHDGLLSGGRAGLSGPTAPPRASRGGRKGGSAASLLYVLPDGAEDEGEDGDGHGADGDRDGGEGQADTADAHGGADAEPLARAAAGPLLVLAGRRLLLLVEELLRGEDRGDEFDLPGVVGGGDRVGRGLLQGVAHAVHPLTRVAMRGHAQTPARKATAAGWAATVRTATASAG